jgi:hypothetical protein
MHFGCIAKEGAQIVNNLIISEVEGKNLPALAVKKV